MLVAHAPRTVRNMATSGNDLEVLSHEDFIIDTFRKLLNSYYELDRRSDVTKDFLLTLCGMHLDTLVWFHLWEAGGAQRFTDIRKSAGCSRPSLSDALRTLLKAGLIRMVEGNYPYTRYQAITPDWLVRISLPSRGKS